VAPDTDIVVASPTNAVSGVVKTPPTAIRGAIRSAVAEALASIPEGKTSMAEVAVSLEDGVNLVYAHKSPSGRWEAAAYVGRRWDGEIAAGAVVTATW
jgi:hypothetical protein